MRNGEFLKIGKMKRTRERKRGCIYVEQHEKIQSTVQRIDMIQKWSMTKGERRKLEHRIMKRSKMEPSRVEGSAMKLNKVEHRIVERRIVERRKVE